MSSTENAGSRKTVGRPMEVLLIEDNLEDARNTISSLHDGSIPCRVTLCVDGEEALRFLRREAEFRQAPRPDLILLDIELPKCDGIEILDRIRGDRELANMPVVVLTASRTHQAVFFARRLHVDEYMTKPVSVEQFLRVVRTLRHKLLRGELDIPVLE